MKNSSGNNKLKVLHDWDEPYNGGLWYFKKGIKYLLYAVCKQIGFPNLIKEVAEEPKITAKLIAMIDEIAGIHGIFGIRDDVKKVYPDTISELENMNVEIRNHLHIGEYPDPTRKRLWQPSLNQPIRTWHYDTKYVSGNKLLLKNGELPIWHVNEDSSKNFQEYIKFLYNVLCQGEEIYENSS
jgi:hypothetical protein